MVVKLPFSSAANALKALADREVSAVDLTQACLDRIETLNPHLHAFRDIIAERALQDADRVDASRRRGTRTGPLAGLPVAVKENINTTPARCPAGVAFRQDHYPEKDAAATAALRKAGAVVLGVTVTDPGAFGVRTEEVTHPRQPSLSVGGSSGGSAAALAAELCYGALGTDTGGSIRVPSACCATVGLKPTRERVSLEGVFPLVWSLDHVGPMARDVDDTALLAAALDPDGFSLPLQPRKAVVGYDPDYFSDAEEAIQQDFRTALAACRERGYEVVEVALPKPDEVRPVHRGIFSIESWAFYSSTFPHAVDEYPALASEMFSYARSQGPEAYVLATRQRAAFKHQVQALFAHVDFILTPTLPLLRPDKEAQKFKIGEQWLDFTSALVRYTSLFDHTGHPALVIPMGIQDFGLATSLQIIGPLDAERSVLQFGSELEETLGLEIVR